MATLDSIAEALAIPRRSVFIRELIFVFLGLILSWVGAFITLTDEPPGIEPASMTLTMALVAPALIVLLFRRRFPVIVLAVSIVLLAIVRVEFVPEFQVTSIAFTIAFYACGRYGRAGLRDWMRGVASLGVVGIIIYEVQTFAGDIEAMGFTKRSFYLSVALNSIWNLCLFAVTWWAAELARKRADRERELAARTLELEASREENARRAVMDERVRIAREIHDVVAHHVSVMGVQAGAARRVVSVNPDAAEQPLRAIEASSREAVTELHRLLGFLRRVDEPDPDGVDADALMPAPGLARLPDLRAQLAAAGLALRLSIEGDERPLPPSVNLNAYRILQEALTNCLKYAGVDVAEVGIVYGTDSLVLTVRDRGRGRPDGDGGQPATSSGGAGLIGMAERVALLGGSLQHGNRNGGGFEVVATLPYAGAVEAAPSMNPNADPMRVAGPRVSPA